MGPQRREMFKKRKNLNIRQRRLSEDERNGENDTTPSLSNEDDSITFPQPTKKEKKKSKDKGDKKVASVLSFEDDLEADDGVVFQEKKSSLSYKLRKEMKKEKKEKQR